MEKIHEILIGLELTKDVPHTCKHFARRSYTMKLMKILAHRTADYFIYLVEEGENY